MKSKNPSLRNYFILALLFLLLLIPNVYLAFHGSDFMAASLFKKFLFLLLSFILVSVPLLFLRPKIYLIIGILFVLMGPFELATIFLYRAPVNSGIFMAVINTNYSEAAELLQGMAWYQPRIVRTQKPTYFIRFCIFCRPYQYQFAFNTD